MAPTYGTLCPSEFVIMIEHLIRGIPITCDALHRLYNATPHAVSCHLMSLSIRLWLGCAVTLLP